MLARAYKEFDLAHYLKSLKKGGSMRKRASLILEMLAMRIYLMKSSAAHIHIYYYYYHITCF